MIQLRTFAGERPIVEPLNLQDEQATLCRDCYLHSTALDPLRHTLFVEAGYAKAKTLFMACGKMIYMSRWTNFARSPIIQDKHERIYWTQCNGTGLRVESASNMTNDAAGTNLSNLKPPTAKPTVVVDRGGAGTDTEAIQFVLTFIDTSTTPNVEIAPSPLSNSLQYIDGTDGVKLTLIVPTDTLANGEFRYKKKRIYAFLDGNYYLLAELDRTEATYIVNPLKVSTTTAVTLPTPPLPTVNVAPVAALIQGGDNTKSTAFVYTYVTVRDEETAPSPASEVITYNDGVDCATISWPAPTNPDVVKVRLYMAVEGDYYLLVELPASTTSYTVCPLDDDFINGNQLDPDSIVGVPLTTDNYDPAPKNLCGLIGLPNGVLAGFTNDSGCEMTGTVHFSEPYQPHAWPVEYRIKIRYKIVALAEVPEGVLVLTEGRPSIITGSTPEVMQEHTLETYQSCRDKRSVVHMGTAVFWSSPDGVAVYGGRQVKVVSENVWSREQWQRLEPDEMIFGLYEDQLVIYPQAPVAPDDALTQAEQWRLKRGEGVLYNLQRGDVTRMTEGNVHALLYEVEHDALWIVRGDNLERFNEGEKMEAEWIGKTLVVPAARTYNSARLIPEADTLFSLHHSTNDATVGRHDRADEIDTAFWSRSITDQRPFRVGSAGRMRGIRLGFKLIGKERLRAAFLAQDMREIP